MRARDLSLGGLYCTSSVDFPEMTRLAVTLMLPGSRGGTEPLEMEAVVVRRQAVGASSSSPRFELGLFFVSVNDEQRARLTRFLDARS